MISNQLIQTLTDFANGPAVTPLPIDLALSRLHSVHVVFTLDFQTQQTISGSAFLKLQPDNQPAAAYLSLDFSGRFTQTLLFTGEFVYTQDSFQKWIKIMPSDEGNDPRLFFIGRWLVDHSIDQLLQLLSIDFYTDQTGWQLDQSTSSNGRRIEVWKRYFTAFPSEWSALIGSPSGEVSLSIGVKDRLLYDWSYTPDITSGGADASSSLRLHFYGYNDPSELLLPH